MWARHSAGISTTSTPAGHSKQGKVRTDSVLAMFGKP